MSKVSKKDLLRARSVALKYAVASLEGAINNCELETYAQERRVMAAILVLNDLKDEVDRMKEEEA
jgi:hypothetical protein